LFSDAPIVNSLTPILACDPFELNTKLECEIDSYPESTITWTYNHQQIFPSNKYSIIQNNTSSYLIIQQLQSNFDYGLYTCNASNRLGRNSTTIQLRSKGKLNSSHLSSIVCLKTILIKDINHLCTSCCLY